MEKNKKLETDTEQVVENPAPSSEDIKNVQQEEPQKDGQQADNSESSSVGHDAETSDTEDNQESSVEYDASSSTDETIGENAVGENEASPEETDDTSHEKNETVNTSAVENSKDTSKQNSKRNKIIKGVVGVALAASCIIGGVGYNNYQKAKPDSRLNQAVALVQEGDFDEAASYASKSGYWSMTDLLGSDATDAQRAKIAKLMYGDLDFDIKKVSVNEAGTEAVITAKVKNYNVYSAALGVQITTEEMAGKTAAESRALLVKKADKEIKAYKKKNKKIANTVHFNMIKKNDKWVVDTSDNENKMSLLSLLGIQVDTYETSSSTDTNSEKKTTSKKDSKKKTSSKKDEAATSESETSKEESTEAAISSSSESTDENKSTSSGASASGSVGSGKGSSKGTSKNPKKASKSKSKTKESSDKSSEESSN